MKNIIIILAATFILTFFNNCRKDTIGSTSICTVEFEDSSDTHKNGIHYQNIIDKYVNKGLPGIVLLIEDENGVWIGSGGKADIENHIDMYPCTVSKVASITKLFVGTLTMMLFDEGHFDLDDKISKYLPAKIVEKIENADEATIRQLLNHTSGIYDHVADQGFYLKLLDNPNKNWKPEELLKFVYKKPAYFETGKGVHYSNTNFLLLSMIIDEATGTSHAKLLRDKIIEPFGLKDTYYHWHDDLPNTTAQGYYDLYNNGVILNMSNYHTGSGNGYGGIYSTVKDMHTFLNALLVDKTIYSNPELLDIQMTFTSEAEYDEENEARHLGLGLFLQYFNGREDDEYAYGHGGRDFQYSADLYLFPKNNTKMAYLVNYGTNGTTSLKAVFSEFRSAVVEEIFSEY